MPKWISIEKAAFKYGINEEVIWLWIEMNRFPVAYTKEPPAVDEEGMDDFCVEVRIGLWRNILIH